MTRQIGYNNRRKQRSFTETASKIATKAVGTASVVLATQALYVKIKTPRLKPPPQSGHEFVEDGLLVELETESESEYDKNISIGESKSNCLGKNENSEDDSEIINVVLLGDSPVEGIGNETHDESLGGQTAKAIMRSFQKSVRYWSLGKSGLTAKGIEEEMLPLMKNVSKKHKIDLIIVSCGVNNVLYGQSADTFGNELNSLLDVIEDCRLRYSTPVILIGLIDFSHMPFLPFPLSHVFGWRSRALQKKMEEIVDCRSLQRMITIAQMPEVDQILNDIDHPLLENVAKDEKKNLKIDDFFADDGFHPARFGTIMLGNLLSQTYKEMSDIIKVR
jgi:hypothetical protein